MRSNASGFTILEVLVAFVIMALVVSMLLPGQGDMFARAQRSNEQLLAGDVMQSLVALERATGMDASERTLDLPLGWQMSRTVRPQVFHDVSGTTVTFTLHGQYQRLLAERTIWTPSQ
ncbi:type II secretion system GspH family protein [Tateyamaria omphalii]|uniref:type II secretion system protein n=1 Tax=Tateyamaria omphalii TaxID=299262 RepID=UPI001C998DD3|nr:type II secretion system protein [Tateyamaria omphalii]MBY5934926.1 type II secretion system GspH family protein [Tateyamaria omphalii]